MLDHYTDEQLEDSILKKIYLLYVKAISQLVSSGYDEHAVLEVVLRNGHCHGSMDPLNNIMHNAQIYLIITISVHHILGLITNSSIQIPPLSIKLEIANYCLWRSTIISALETFDLESIVLDTKPPTETRTVAAPTPTDPPTIEINLEFQQWKKRDRYVLLWLKSTLSERALATIARATSSRLAWIALEKHFQAQTRARQMSMKVQLQSLSKGSLIMLEYVEKKRSIADSLAENDHPVSTEDPIGYIHSGLDSSYGPFIAAFMVKGDTSTIDDLIGFLLLAEARLEQEHLRQQVVAPTAPNSTVPLALTTNRHSNRNNFPVFGAPSSSNSRSRSSNP
uniref:PIR2-like helical domain-containing protein n=1 Tax=Lactuca sativa TaxID=4236 RepID=A0A9R1VGK1_LACSA|nr:hypothetical protein LSAT_V11C500243480 [Lactuca sativa]